MSETPRHPIMVATILVFKEGKVLLGRRKGSGAGAGMFGSPGGRLEHDETFEACIHRELQEEVGAIQIKNIRFVCLMNVRAFLPQHFVVAVFRADWESGEPQTLEPDKCECWEWFDPNALPDPVTPSLPAALAAMNGGSMFIESA